MVAELVLGLAACDHAVDPNAPPPYVESRGTENALASHESFIITGVSLSSTTLVLNGPSVTYTVSVFSSVDSFKGMGLSVSFIQQQVRHAIRTQGVPCGSGSSSCTITNSVEATGLLTGPAIFEVQFLAASGVVLNTQDVAVNIAPGQTIRALGVNPASVVLGGLPGSYTATLQNQAASISGVDVQGWLSQSGTNTARRAAGGASVQCGSGSGVLPTGTCTVSNAITASNRAEGAGTLEPGPAMFELDLRVNGILVSLDSVPVTLISSAMITSAALTPTASDTILLESSTSFNAALRNVGSSMTGISIQGWVTQGTTRRFAGGSLISCGGGAGALPNGTCSVSSIATVTDNSAGEGTLVTGAADLELQLVDASGTVLSTARIPLSLIDGPLESGPPGPSSNSVVRRKPGS